jgi:hypothetical protein
MQFLCIEQQDHQVKYKLLSFILDWPVTGGKWWFGDIGLYKDLDMRFNKKASGYQKHRKYLCGAMRFSGPLAPGMRGAK